jgi:hypothetical protein
MTVVQTMSSKRAVNRRWAFLAAVAVIGGGGGALVVRSMLPAPAPVATPPTVAAASASLKSVAGIDALSVTSSRLETTSTITSPTSAGYVDRAAGIVPRFLAAFQNASGEDTGKAQLVAMTFAAAGFDRLGNRSPDPLFTLVFSATDLRAANFANLGPYSAMGLAKTVAVAGPDGRAALEVWCPSASGAAREFCAKALAK